MRESPQGLRDGRKRGRQAEKEAEDELQLIKWIRRFSLHLHLLILHPWEGPQAIDGHAPTGLGLTRDQETLGLKKQQPEVTRVTKEPLQESGEAEATSGPKGEQLSRIQSSPVGLDQNIQM